jgi:hypothetical protein
VQAFGDFACAIRFDLTGPAGTPPRMQRARMSSIGDARNEQEEEEEEEEEAAHQQEEEHEREE